MKQNKDNQNKNIVAAAPLFIMHIRNALVVCLHILNVLTFRSNLPNIKTRSDFTKRS